ncbi:MAG: hypothetical protein ACI8PT_001698 [Gammaproteobacteria bacterium]|jgi:hypothetical protein
MTRTFGRFLLGFVALGLTSVFHHQAFATDFPAGSVVGATSLVISCSNISGIGASATRSGADLDITIPSGGVLLAPVVLKSVNIPINSSGAAAVTLTGAEALTDSSSPALALSEAGPIAFSVTTGTMSGACSAAFTIAGSVSLPNLSNTL